MSYSKGKPRCAASLCHYFSCSQCFYFILQSLPSFLSNISAQHDVHVIGTRHRNVKLRGQKSKGKNDAENISRKYQANCFCKIVLANDNSYLSLSISLNFLFVYQISCCTCTSHKLSQGPFNCHQRS